MKPGIAGSGLRSFLLRLPVATLLALVAWTLLRPALDAATAGLAEILIRAYEHPRVTRLAAVDHRAEVRRADYRTDTGVPTIALTEVHSNTVVLFALFLALGRPLARIQLERLIMGWALLFLCQVVNVMAHVKFIYATSLGAWSLMEYSDLARNFYGYLQVATDLPVRLAAPVVIWAGMSWGTMADLFGLEPGGDGRRERKR